jgi:uncharacterized protein (TIGR00730 family)
MQAVSVFCGSSTGNDPLFLEAARTLGTALARSGITLVYGGARIGLMGVIADAVLAEGGKAVGVLPRFLDPKERAHTGLTELILTETMHERKAKMYELSEGFIALPGGWGTLDEVIEVLTWSQLGLHGYPVALLNVGGFFDQLRGLFDVMERKQLLRPENKKKVLFRDDVGTMLKDMKEFRALPPKIAGPQKGDPP